MVLETEGIVDVVGDEEEIVAETGEGVVAPKGLPSLLAYLRRPRWSITS